jgi:hypothetical protein
VFSCRTESNLWKLFRYVLPIEALNHKLNTVIGYFSDTNGYAAAGQILQSQVKVTIAFQVRGFKPGRSRRIFKGGTILSTPSFGREVKPWVPCRRFAACKRSLNVPWKSAFRQNYRSHYPAHKFQLPPLECGARRQARGHLVAKVGTSKAGGTKSRLGWSTSVTCHGRPWKQTNKNDSVSLSLIKCHSIKTYGGQVISIPNLSTVLRIGCCGDVSFLGFRSKWSFIFRIIENNSPFSASHRHQLTAHLSKRLRNIQITTAYKTRTTNSMAEVKRLSNTGLGIVVRVFPWTAQ